MLRRRFAQTIVIRRSIFTNRRFLVVRFAASFESFFAATREAIFLFVVVVVVVVVIAVFNIFPLLLLKTLSTFVMTVVSRRLPWNMSSRIDIVPSKELNLTRRVIPRVTARIRPRMVFYNSRTLFDDTFDFAMDTVIRRRGDDT